MQRGKTSPEACNPPSPLILQAAPAAGFAASRAYSSGKAVVTDWEHATGIELKELEAAVEGKDYFDHFDFMKQVRERRANARVFCVYCVCVFQPHNITGTHSCADDRGLCV